MAYKIRKTLIIFWAMVLLLELGKPLPVAAAVMEREREKSTPSGIAYSDLAERIEKFIQERKSAAASVSLQGCRVLIRIQEVITRLL